MTPSRLPRQFLLFALSLALFLNCSKSDNNSPPKHLTPGCRISYLTNGTLVDTLFYDDSLRMTRFKQYWLEYRYSWTDSQLFARCYNRYGNQIGLTTVSYNKDGSVSKLAFKREGKEITRVYEYKDGLLWRVLQTQNQSAPYKDTFTYEWDNGNLLWEHARYGSFTPSYDSQLWQQADLLNITYLYNFGVSSPIRTKNLMTHYSGIKISYLFDSAGRVNGRLDLGDTTRYTWFCQ